MSEATQKENHIPSRWRETSKMLICSVGPRGSPVVCVYKANAIPCILDSRLVARDPIRESFGFQSLTNIDSMPVVIVTNCMGQYEG